MNRNALKEISQNSLFFHSVFSFFRCYLFPLLSLEKDETESKRVKTEASVETTVVENCILSVGAKPMQRPRCMINMVLMILHDFITHLDETCNLESVKRLLESVVMISWEQCQLHHLQPVTFTLDRKRDHDITSISHFQILLIDLVQSLSSILRHIWSLF